MNRPPMPILDRDDRGSTTKEEISELFEDLEEPTDDPPVDDPPAEEPDEGEEEEVEEPEDELEEEPEETPEEPKEDSITVPASEFQALMDRVNALESGSASTEESGDEPASTPEDAISRIPALDVTEEELDEALDSPEALSTLLRKVQVQAVEAAMQLLPDLAVRAVEERTATANVVQEFFEENAELKPFQQYVGIKANTIAEQHPNMSVKQVLQQAADEVRASMDTYAKALGLEKKAKEEGDDADDEGKVKKPTKAPASKARSSTRSKTQLSEKQQAIADTFKDLN